MYGTCIWEMYDAPVASSRKKHGKMMEDWKMCESLEAPSSLSARPSKYRSFRHIFLLYYQILGNMSSIENNLHGSYVGRCWGTQIRPTMAHIFEDVSSCFIYVCIKEARAIRPNSRNRTSMNGSAPAKYLGSNSISFTYIHVAYCQGFLGIGFLSGVNRCFWVNSKSPCPDVGRFASPLR